MNASQHERPSKSRLFNKQLAYRLLAIFLLLTVSHASLIYGAYQEARRQQYQFMRQASNWVIAHVSHHLKASDENSVEGLLQDILANSRVDGLSWEPFEEGAHLRQLGWNSVDQESDLLYSFLVTLPHQALPAGKMTFYVNPSTLMSSIHQWVAGIVWMMLLNVLGVCWIVYWFEKQSRKRFEGPLMQALREEVLSQPHASSLADLEAMEPESLCTLWLQGRTEKQAQVQGLQTASFQELPIILNPIPIGLLILASDLKTLYWNQAAETFLGSPLGDVGGPFNSLWPQWGRYAANLAALVAGGPAGKLAKAMKSMDETRYFDIYAATIVLQTGVHLLVQLIDTTLDVKWNETLVQTEKLTAIGALAGGIVHEINNPLGAILQSAQNMLRRLDAKVPANRTVAHEIGIDLEKIRDYLTKRQFFEFLYGIRQAGERAAHIVTNLLQFGRKSQGNKCVANIVKIVENAIELANMDHNVNLQQDFKYIRLIREFEPNLPPIYCAVTEIEQVILNLLKNAAQALATVPKAPVIYIRIKAITDAIQIEVEDNGPGIPKDIQGQIFEPFFTTKPEGMGTGLGLSVSYNLIVLRHQGTFKVDSQEGRGANFIIQLPTQPMSTLAQSD